MSRTIKSTLIIFSILVGFTRTIQAQQYSAIDVACLQTILDGNSNGNLPWDFNTSKEYHHITWVEKNNEYRVSELRLQGQKMKTIDVTPLAELTYLNIQGNNLNDIDLKSNLNLRIFSCLGNNFKAIDLSKNELLEALFCQENQIVDLDISHNTKLFTVDCSENKLQSISFLKNPDLYKLICDENEIVSLDLSNNNKLYRLSCQHNKLPLLDLGNNVAIEILSCNSNLLTELDLSTNVVLKTINCERNQLTTIDFSACPLLWSVNCQFNNLYSINVIQNPKITSLHLGGNELKSLDVSNIIKMNILGATSNRLSFKSMESTINASINSKHRNIQDSLFSKQWIDLGGEINYSGETPVNGKDVEFRWFKKLKDEEDLLMETNTTGVYQPTTEGQYYVKMTHPDFTETSSRYPVFVSMSYATIVGGPKIESTIESQSLEVNFPSFTVDLTKVFEDKETSDANLKYSFSGNSNILISITDGIATISSTEDWLGEENVTFIAIDEKGLSNSIDVKFVVSPKNESPVIEQDIEDFILLEDFDAFSIDLKEVFEDSETSDLDLDYTFSGTSNIQVLIVDGIATISSLNSWNGKEVITFSTIDEGGATTSTSVTFEVTTISGFNHVQNLISVYPTYVKSNVFVQSEQHISSIEIVNMHGEVLLKTNETSMYVQQLPKGTYLIRVQIGAHFITKKFIKE